jgi:VIT1/CCC1 family predicted Fe2+/Mn2+ transporter
MNYENEHLRKSSKRTTSSWLNSLRAAVLGANDGIVSTAGLVIGVASASSSYTAILAAGISGIISGAISMAAGEYVSVSSQRDTELTLIKNEKRHLVNYPTEEREELIKFYEAKGLKRETAERVVSELPDNNAFTAHIEMEFGVNPNDLVSPWRATISSALSFFTGSLIPLSIITLSPSRYRILATFISVIISLTVTGALSAKAGGSSKVKASTRVVAWGIGAMIITYLIGLFIGKNGL